MSPIQLLSRGGPLLLLAALMSGCSSSSSSPVNPWSSPAAPGSGPDSSRVSLECRVSRNSCLYNGKYEVGERDYAEEEAKRLNRAEMERLRRAFGG
ncbi:hypothetical protein [Achromobacter ruhlandii]|uniref:Uncharacterized protein n=1 Tax=Achromobacter ruhlandii TaxID=72557 RepID=A0A2M9GSQ2_9BURK|nr:hypothetical protein [Achromobacter ruhlandii]PJM67577.1 hypothetical protein CV751_24415 [Achromobacter ruhlandii]CAB3838915.1 hypothetical protein LMG3328_01164 [Achromobacter ruhlandii]